MKNSRSLPLSLSLVVVLAGTVLVGCAGPRKEPSPQVLQQIQHSRTVGDHAALSAHYGNEASAARAKVAEHLERAEKYGQFPVGRTGLSVRTHCNRLAAQYEGLAAQYQDLSAYHRLLADRP